MRRYIKYFRKYPDACVMYIDAHTDINTVDTTESGNMHGMPIAFLLGLGSKVDEFSWIKPLLKADRLVYIGLRDVDASEKKILRDNNIKAFSMREVDKYGIGKVVEMALDHVNLNRDRPIHLSFDIDALDPTVAPATGLPVHDGLTSREGHYICEAISETGLLAALDIVFGREQYGDGLLLRVFESLTSNAPRMDLKKSAPAHSVGIAYTLNPPPPDAYANPPSPRLSSIPKSATSGPRMYKGRVQ
ncbi:hypothetical protein NLJ89_g11018 [Agrocybe chaxingu]|uniref:Arginase n=1 Tax=Agrocybe chaxingu TaxID=84603 RepID=A0A9W8MS13_9AGAR|nr:hypothetical protein NLJ89_g11018 [Agrocybe chaxingu]